MSTHRTPRRLAIKRSVAIAIAAGMTFSTVQAVQQDARLPQAHAEDLSAQNPSLIEDAWIVDPNNNRLSGTLTEDIPDGSSLVFNFKIPEDAKPGDTLHFDIEKAIQPDNAENVESRLALLEGAVAAIETDDAAQTTIATAAAGSPGGSGTVEYVTITFGDKIDALLGDQNFKRAYNVKLPIANSSRVADTAKRTVKTTDRQRDGQTEKNTLATAEFSLKQRGTEYKKSIISGQFKETITYEYDGSSSGDPGIDLRYEPRGYGIFGAGVQEGRPNSDTGLVRWGRFYLHGFPASDDGRPIEYTIDLPEGAEVTPDATGNLVKQISVEAYPFLSEEDARAKAKPGETTLWGPGQGERDHAMGEQVKATMEFSVENDVLRVKVPNPPKGYAFVFGFGTDFVTNYVGAITYDGEVNVVTPDNRKLQDIKYPVTEVTGLIAGDDIKRQADMEVSIVKPGDVLDNGEKGPVLVQPGDVTYRLTFSNKSNVGLLLNTVTLPDGKMLPYGDTVIPKGDNGAPGTGYVDVTVKEGQYTQEQLRNFKVKFARLDQIEDSISVISANPTYTGITVQQGKEKKGAPPEFAPGGSTFKPGKDFPTWATIDPSTGEITVKPGIDVPIKDYPFEVEVTFPDNGGSTSVPVTVKVTKGDDKDLNEPKYTDISVQQGEKGKVNQPTPKTPTGTTFTPKNPLPEWAKINPDTGEITVKPNTDVNPADYTFDIVANYPDKTTDDLTVRVTVTKAPDNDLYNPSYEDAKAKPGKSTSVDVTVGTLPKWTDKLPNGTSFSIDGPKEWTPKIDPKTGKATVTVPKTPDVKAGDKETFTVTVTYPDNNTDTVTFDVLVLNEPKYDGGSVKPGGEPVKIDHTGTVVPGSKFTLQPGQDLGTGRSEWKVTVDEKTGEVTAIAPPKATPGTTKDIRVEVTDPNNGNKKDVVAVKVTVLNDPAYRESSNKPGNTVVLEQVGRVVDGSAFEIDPNQYLGSWKPKIDPNTGQITVRIPENAEPGTSRDIKVKVTDPNGNVETVEATVHVLESQVPGYDTVTTNPNTHLDIKPNDGTVPPDSTFEIIPNDLDATIDPNTGVISVDIPDNPEDSYTFWVTVKDPNGDEHFVPVTVLVNKDQSGAGDPQNPAGEVSYPKTPAVPGTGVTVVPVKPEDIPTGTTFEPKPNQPWNPSVDPTTGEVTVTVPNDATPGEHTITVIVKKPGEPDVEVPVVLVVTPENENPEAPETRVPVEYPEKITVTPGQPEKVTEPKILVPLPEDTTFEIKPQKPGEERPFTPVIDPVTGEIVVKVPEGTPPGDYPIVVVVTPPGEEPFEIPVTIVVTPEPRYPDKTFTVPGTEVTVTPVNPNEIPTGTTFAPKPNQPWNPTVDSKTGEITVEVPEDTPPGEYPVTVTVTPPGGQPVEVDVTVVVTPVSYPEKPTTPNTTVELTPTIPTPLPNGTTFVIKDPETPLPVTPVIDQETGKITVEVPEGTPPGKYPVTVIVTPPNGDDPFEVPAVVVVTPNVSYPKTPAVPGTGVTVVPVKPEEIPTGTTFEPKPDQPWNPSVDPTTGEVTVTVPNDATPGEHTITVIVKKPGEPDVEVPVVVVVTPVTYPETPVTPGETTTITPVDPDTIPTGTTFEPKPNQPWNPSVDPTTGEVTVTVPNDATPGEHEIIVVVTPPNGEPVEVPVTVLVTPPVTYPNKTHTGPGTAVTITPINPDKIPTGTTFAPKDPNDPWKPVVDPNTGTISVRVPDDAKPGEHTITVTVQKPGQPPVDIPVVVVVTPVGYPDTHVTPGQPPVKVTPNVDTQMPRGTNYTIKPGQDLPFTPTIDRRTGIITVEVPVGTPTGDYPVAIVVTPRRGEPFETTANVIVRTTPVYEPATGQPNMKVDIAPNPGTVPEGMTFEVKYPDDPWQPTVDPDTGVLTVKVPAGMGDGDRHTVVVVTKDPKTGVTQEVDVVVNVTVPEQSTPVYDPSKGQPGEEVTITPKPGTVPTGSTFEMKDPTDPWQPQVDPNTGVVTVTVPDGAGDGDTHTVIVKVTNPNTGETVEVPVTVTVDNPPAPTDPNAPTTPTYNPGEGKPGEQVTLTPKPGMVPDGVTFRVKDPSDPWQPKVDPTTGVVTVTVPNGASDGDQHTVVIVVTDPSGNSVEVPVVVTVKDPAESTPPTTTTPVYEPKPVQPGEEATTAPNPGTVPEGTTFKVKDPSQPWSPTVDPTTGELTVKVPESARDGDKQTVVIIVTDPNGNETEVKVQLTVGKPAKPERPGSSKGSSDSSSNLPEKCVPALLGWGIPMLLLVPLGLLAQVKVPGIEHLQAQFGQQIRQVNTEIQKGLGIHDPRVAGEVARINDQLAAFGSNVGQVAGGIALVGIGIAAITHITLSCAPTQAQGSGEGSGR